MLWELRAETCVSPIFDKRTSVEVLYNGIVRKYSSLPEPVERTVEKDGRFWIDRFDQMVVNYKASKVDWLLPKLCTLLLEYLCFEHFFLL